MAATLGKAARFCSRRKMVASKPVCAKKAARP